LRKRLPFARLYLFTFLGFCLSGVLDAFTSYGTHLLWPISDERVAFNMISVIDPVFSLILLTAVVIAFKKHARAAARVGLLLASVYMSFGWVQLQRAESIAGTLAADRGHVIDELLVKPTLANLVLWRSIYESDGRLHVDAIRVGLFSESRVYPGDSVDKFVLERDMRELSPTSVLATDIKRFTKFSAGLVAIRPEQPDVLIDVRYANLPMNLYPLWGIEMDITQPDQHAKYTLYRDASGVTRKQFLTLLKGNDLD
jgi:inner membrane protein